MKLHEFWKAASDLVNNHDQRWGQAVFNTIPSGTPGLTEIAGTLDDPYYRVKTRTAAYSWVDRYLAVDSEGTIREVRLR